MRTRVLIRRITRAPARWRRRRMVRRSAAALRSFGVDVPRSDWQAYRQLTRCTRRMSKIVPMMGVTADELREGFRRFSELMQAGHNNP